jgi:hypothetical protein
MAGTAHVSLGRTPEPLHPAPEDLPFQRRNFFLILPLRRPDASFELRLLALALGQPSSESTSLSIHGTESGCEWGSFFDFFECRPLHLRSAVSVSMF